MDLNYEIENYENRTLFVFYTDKITFNQFSAAIDEIIQPDAKSVVETTSWTQSFIFTKDGIQIYFENFYLEKPYFSFELFPLESDNDYDFKKLKSKMDFLQRKLNN
jgi:hypothetical protein